MSIAMSDITTEQLEQLLNNADLPVEDQPSTIPDPPMSPPPAPIQLPQSGLVTSEHTVSGQVEQLLSAFGGSVLEIIQNQRSDRNQVNDIAVIVEGQVRHMITSGNVKNITPFLEALSNLLKTKTDINANASRALDSIARLISAGKSNDLIVAIGGGVAKKGSLNLEELLQQPLNEDELKDASQ